MIMPKKPMFGGYIGTGVVRRTLPIYPANTGSEGIISFIQQVTNIFK
jgi:hypothetical protein